MAFQNEWGRTLNNFISGHLLQTFKGFLPLLLAADCSVCYCIPQKNKSRCWDRKNYLAFTNFGCSFSLFFHSFSCFINPNWNHSSLPPFQPTLSPMAFKSNRRKSPPVLLPMPLTTGIPNPRKQLSFCFLHYGWDPSQLASDTYGRDI